MSDNQKTGLELLKDAGVSVETITSLKTHIFRLRYQKFDVDAQHLADVLEEINTRFDRLDRAVDRAHHLAQNVWFLGGAISAKTTRSGPFQWDWRFQPRS